MAHCLARTTLDNLNSLRNSLLRLSIADPIVVQHRGRKQLNPRQPFIKNPIWLVRKERKFNNEFLTHENKSFVKEIIHDKYGEPAVIGGIATYTKSGGILKDELELPKAEWSPKTIRCGVIARKIGVYPLWFKDGSKIQTTLLQIVDNHVIKYVPPGEVFANQKPRKRIRYPDRYGALIVGAESVNPTTLTKEYCGLFKNSGVMPKRILSKFMITPNAFLNPGTPLTAAHYRVGDYIDVKGKTIDRGFQGVMKRWGFKGMPASHGVTKTHRRGGNIGGGGEKARVWPGTKMPGRMGGRFRICRGVRIWRMNTKYNVLWVSGLSIPGDTNSFCYIYDTILPLRRAEEAPPFPTSFPNAETDLPEDLYCDEIHPFSDPTVTFDVEKL